MFSGVVRFVRTPKTVEVPLLILSYNTHTGRQLAIIGRSKIRKSILWLMSPHVDQNTVGYSVVHSDESELNDMSAQIMLWKERSSQRQTGCVWHAPWQYTVNSQDFLRN